jgi:hypothetical protein
MTQPQVSGLAVYFEFRKSQQTWQVLITPESREDRIPASMFRRRLNPAQPRKMWKQIASNSMSAELSVPVNTDLRLSFAKSMLDSLVINSWTLYKNPIVVEVTKEDLADIRSGKTPYKIIGRVLKSRKKLGFADKLFGEV